MDAEVRKQARNHPLAAASRVANDQAEQDGDLPTTVERYGLDWPVLNHMAEQRALRVLGQMFPLAPMALEMAVLLGATSITDAVASVLPSEEKTAFIAAYTASIDGLTIGWLGHQYSAEGTPEEAKV